MVDNLDNLSFGIVDTMERGLGDAQLLIDLQGPETSTGDPDKLEPIVKEVEPENKAEEKVPKGKEITPKEEGKEPSAQSKLSDFLQSDENEEQEEETVEQKVEEPEKKEEVEEAEGTFAALSRDLLKLGVFTTEEGEQESPVNTPAEFLERFNNEKKKGAIEIVNNFIGQFGEDYQQAFQAIFVKGVDPKEYFSTYNDIVNLSELDLSKEENQTAVIRRALSEQGFEPDDITSEIDRLKNYGDLETVAAKHHKVLVKKDAVKLQEKEAKAEQEQQQKAFIRNQYIQNVQTVLQDKLKVKEFDGIPLNQKIATELQDFLLVDKYKTASGETLTDFDRTILELKRPENHAMKVKIALLIKLLEKDPTLSTIQRSGVTKKTDQIFSEVARQVTKTKVAPGNTGQQERSKSWFTE